MRNASTGYYRLELHDAVEPDEIGDACTSLHKRADMRLACTDAADTRLYLTSAVRITNRLWQSLLCRRGTHGLCPESVNGRATETMRDRLFDFDVAAALSLARPYSSHGRWLACCMPLSTVL
jgi:hypothetical protein